MLRASSQTNADDVDLNALMTGGDASQLDSGNQLSQFAEAIVGGEPETISNRRDALVDSLGADGMVDAAGVASNFQRMVRIADATGIVLGRFESATEELRATLAINAFAQRKM